MTSIIKTNYVGGGILGQMRSNVSGEVTKSTDANNLTDLRKIYSWGYADTPQNVPLGAGYLMNINTGWGLLQICGEYSALNIKMRYNYRGTWTNWKSVSMT